MVAGPTTIIIGQWGRETGDDSRRNENEIRNRETRKGPSERSARRFRSEQLQTAPRKKKKNSPPRAEFAVFCFRSGKDEPPLRFVVGGGKEKKALIFFLIVLLFFPALCFILGIKCGGGLFARTYLGMDGWEGKGMQIAGTGTRKLRIGLMRVVGCSCGIPGANERGRGLLSCASGSFFTHGAHGRCFIFYF